MALLSAGATPAAGAVIVGGRAAAAADPVPARTTASPVPMVRRHWRMAAATAVPEGSSTTAPAVADGPATRNATGDLVAVSCPTASLCYAVGVNTKGSAVLDTIVHGRQTRSETFPRLYDVTGSGNQDISCPTSSFCGIVGYFYAPSGVPVFATLSHGNLSLMIKLSWFPSEVQCPAAGRCVIAGAHAFAGGSILEAAIFDHGQIAKPSEHSLPQRFTPVGLHLACLSTSLCEMVGTAADSSSSNDHTFYVGLGSGAKIGKVHLVSTAPEGRGTLLEGGIACGRPDSCYLTGSTFYGTKGLLLSVRAGGSKLEMASSSYVFLPTFLSCDTLRSCTATGVTPTTNVPAVESYADGRPRRRERFSHLGSGYVLKAVARLSATEWLAIAAGYPLSTPDTSKILTGSAPS